MVKVPQKYGDSVCELNKKTIIQNNVEIVDENVGVEMDNDDVSNGDDDAIYTGKIGNRAQAVNTHHSYVMSFC